MKTGSSAFMACVVALTPAAALAEDPNDVTMRNPAALARDREMTRQLNLAELKRVRQRDAHLYERRDSETASRSRDHQKALAVYDRSRVRYEQEMVEWRRSVAACRAGDYAACGE